MDNYVYVAKKALHGFEDSREHRGATSAWEDMVDPDVERTLATLLLVLECEDQPAHHGPTTQLFNRIDATVYKLLRPKDGDFTRTFASNARTRPGGGFLDAIIEPDYVAYLGTRLDLEHAVNSTYLWRDLLRPKIEHTDEDQRPDRHDAGVARLRSYVILPKAYRRDLPAVHGFKVLKQRTLFSELKSCDISTAGTAGCDTRNFWLTGIATLCFNADSSPVVLYNAPRADLVRWDVLGTAFRQEDTLSAFCVTRAPGHKPTSQISVVMTSTAVAGEAYFIHEVKGFQKLSSQQGSVRSKEKMLLQSRDKKGRFSSLLRLHENDYAYPELTFALIQPSPCILVTHLDQATGMNLLRTSPDAGRDVTGTPMFMAVELSDYAVREYAPLFNMTLKKAILKTKDLPRDVLLLAFPAGDNDFLTKFLAVMEMEIERDEPRPLSTQPAHNPRHDAESAFWVFFWAAVRAHPRDPSLQPSPAEIDAFGKFCDNMFDHVIDKKKTDRRDAILTSSFARLFHPALRQFASLFTTMARYLNVPWHYYEAEGKAGADHVHVAFQRLILRFFEINIATPAMFGLRLDTEHPRVMARKEVDSTARASALHAAHLSHAGAWGQESELSGHPESGGSTSSKKRKANEPADRGTRSSKRLATKKAAGLEPSQFRDTEAVAQGASAPDYSAPVSQTYREAIHADRPMANAFCRKISKGR